MPSQASPGNQPRTRWSKLAKLNNDGKAGLEPFARLLHDHALISEGKMDGLGFALGFVVMEKAAAGLAATSTTDSAIWNLKSSMLTRSNSANHL